MRRRTLLAVCGALALFGAIATATVAAPAARHGQTLNITITRSGLVGPANVAIAPGLPVKVTITNYTTQYHTFTIPGLGVSAIVKPGSARTPATATFTFTAHLSGWFKWYCYLCEDGLHGHAHHMNGWVLAIVDPKLVR